MTRTEAWRQLPAGAAKVLWALWELAGGAEQTERGEMFLAVRVGVAKIAEHTGMAQRTVRKWMRVLQERGFVDVVRTGRTNGYNVLPFPDGFVGADQDGTSVPDSVDETYQSDRHDDAALHIPTSASPTSASHTNPSRRAPAGGGVVVRLLSQRGVLKRKAEQLERSHDLAEVLAVCAAFDVGELKGAGGLVTALADGWSLKAKPELSSHTSEAVKERTKADALAWRDTLDQDAQRRVLEMVRKSYGNMRTIDDDTDDPSVWASAFQLHRALEWWNKITDDERTTWREVVRTVKPDMKGIDDDRPHAVGAAHRIAHGMAKLAKSEHEQREARRMALTW